MREKPNSSTIAAESMLMFHQNQTAKWLKCKDDQEKRKLFKACIKVGRDQRQVYKQRMNDILVYQEKIVREKEQELAKKKRQKQEQKLALCSKISSNGFWMSVEDALTSLSKLPNETKKKGSSQGSAKIQRDNFMSRVC